MRTGLNALTTALVMSSALVVYAQTPQYPPTTTQPTRTVPDQQRPAPPDPLLTITGCLKEEKATPNAGTPADDSFVLSDVKMAQSSLSSAIGLAPQYEIQGLADVELQKHLNHTVEVTGRLVPAAAAAPTRETTPLKRDLPEFQAISIKMVSATCDAK